ncbi:MAG: hypothetical protein MUO24_04220 [Desulfobacterales bacterium]|nr:hypothetical protein [Desulfobacterales bacterium]
MSFRRHLIIAIIVILILLFAGTAGPGDGHFDFIGFFRHLMAQRLSPTYTLEVHQEKDLPRGTVTGYLESLDKE